jgi:iron(III) transport system substrate-binding protein
MQRLPSPLAAIAAAVLLGLAACSEPSGTDAEVVNVYSGRHYDSDAAVYAAFTEKTGIEVRTVEAEGNQLLERLKASTPTPTWW